MPHPLSFHDTLHRYSVEFHPIDPAGVKVYTCGPTPYNYAHIGNLRTYVFEDVVVRTLRHLGYGVKRVMNVTDIDDKTIRDSQKEGRELLELTRFYTEAFLSDLELLQCQKPEVIAPISGLVPEMVAMIQTLLDKGIAYIADDGVYYSVEKFPEYGRLAHLDRAGMTHSVRIKNDEYEKDSVADFALWKAWDEADGPNKWEAEFVVNGEKKSLPGRPGWHIECSACNMAHFGEEIDIHMGGIDNIFPHHENEIAQSEACTGHTFSRYWLHAGHLMVDGKKMAKSAGNFYTLRQIIEKYPNVKKEKIARAFRLMCLQARYSDSVNFTFDKVNAALRTLDGIEEMIRRLSYYWKDRVNTMPKSLEDMSTEDRVVALRPSFDLRGTEKNLQNRYDQFISHMWNNFDTSTALTYFFDLIAEINKGIDTETIPKDGTIEILQKIDYILQLIDFSLLDEPTDSISSEISSLLIHRDEAKKAKDFDRADALRKEIESAGYRVLDSKDGSRAEKI